MLNFIIHYNGEYQDSISVTGDTIDEVKEKAYEEGSKRGWDIEDCWSEQIEQSEV